MIKSLEINNVALISKLSLNFDNGLTALSGETGSGKSIIVDSLAFVLGERADKTMIKHGEEKAFVEVGFDAGSQTTKAVMSELGFDDDDVIIISRTLTVAGKNECRVNGRVCSASVLRQITSTLVDIFGQSQHLNLLKTDNHLAVIDGFCDFCDKLNSLQKMYTQYRLINRQLQSFGGSLAERERMMDILKFQIDELTNAKLSEDEELQLENQHKRIVNIEKIATGLSTALQYLSNVEPSALSNLSNARNNLAAIEKFDESIKELHARLDVLVIEADDISVSLEKLLHETDYDARQIDLMEARLERIRTIKRKYGGSVKEALNFLEKAKQQYNQLFNATEEIEKLTGEKNIIVKQMYVISQAISAIRKQTAVVFSRNIENHLAELGMKNATFQVVFCDVPTIKDYEEGISANGFDKAEFLFSANKGEPAKPLAKVISGGEMSRFMLAVKNITAAVENIPTMVFDEIDTGISGTIAQMVAIKLSKVSKNYQCIVITHLPQIAAMADSNLYIEKYEKDGRTQTGVQILNEKNSKALEVARLMGGVGEHSLINALEMVKWADDCKAKV